MSEETVWDYKDFQEETLQIDFLEIEMVEKIKTFAEQLDDTDLISLCQVYLMSDDGLESINVFEKIIEQYHDLLRD